MAKKKIDYGSLFTRRKNGLYVATYTDDWGKRHYLSSMDPEKLWHKLNDPQDDPGSCAPFSKVAADWQRQHATEISYQGQRFTIRPSAEPLNISETVTFTPLPPPKSLHTLCPLHSGAMPAALCRSTGTHCG